MIVSTASVADATGTVPGFVHRRNTRMYRRFVGVMQNVRMLLTMNYFDRYQGRLHVFGWRVFRLLPFLTLPDFFLNRLDLSSLAQLFTNVQ
ncbi:hypothetical protein GCM10027190_19500 [Spirosoma areae]